MTISDNFRQILVSEIDYAAKKMEESPTTGKKLYFFSAVHGVIQRIFNLEYDSDLVYAHFVLINTYNSFSERLHAIEKGQEDTIPLSEEQFKKLTVLTEELAKNISGKKDITPTLKKFGILSYTATGNGYYLLQKGLLQI